MSNRIHYLIILSLGIALNLNLLSHSFAQNEPLGPLMSVTELTIKPGHEIQFREGVKAWKACYLQNKGEWTWRVWQRQQGEGSVFVLASDMANWAEMDKVDGSGKDCQNLVTTLINPHVEKAVSHITRFQPGVSKASPLTEEKIRVTFYELNYANGHRMMEVVKEVEAIRKNANVTNRGYWYSWLTADPNSPNFHFVMPYKDYAAMDVVQEAVWDTVEKSAGKAKRDELQSAFRSSIQNTWNYIYTLDKDISNLAK
jgi:hypothetical protein